MRHETGHLPSHVVGCRACPTARARTSTLQPLFSARMHTHSIRGYREALAKFLRPILSPCSDGNILFRIFFPEENCLYICPGQGPRCMYDTVYCMGFARVTRPRLQKR